MKSANPKPNREMLRDRLCQLVEDEKKEGQMLAQFRWKINIISLDEDHHHNNPD